jgi:Uma2 family endonuclease
MPAPAAPERTTHRTAADWWESLGRVPLERIVFNPPPGTATVTDVIRLDDHEDRLCELIDGTLLEKPVGYHESLIAVRLVRLLGDFVDRHDLGRVSGESGMLTILPKHVRIPDVAFISYDRLPRGPLPPAAAPEVAPDLAVEVLSRSNTDDEMNRKRRDYFTAGVRLVWYVDPPTRSVTVYTGPDASRNLSDTDTLDGGEVLPGFSSPVAAIFE